MADVSDNDMPSGFDLKMPEDENDRARWKLLELLLGMQRAHAPPEAFGKGTALQHYAKRGETVPLRHALDRWGAGLKPDTTDMTMLPSNEGYAITPMSPGKGRYSAIDPEPARQKAAKKK